MSLKSKDDTLSEWQGHLLSCPGQLKSWIFYFNIWTCTTVSESIVSFDIILCPCRPWHQRYNIIQFTRAKLDCSRRLTFFLQKSLTGTSDDDRVTHIVLQGFETNGIRVLRRLNSIIGCTIHMGREDASLEKKLARLNFWIFVHKNVYRIRFQKIKIGP